MLFSIVVLATIGLACYLIYQLQVEKMKYELSSDRVKRVIDKLNEDKTSKLRELRWKKLDILDTDIYTKETFKNKINKRFRLIDYMKNSEKETISIMNSGESISFDDLEKMFSVYFESLRDSFSKLRSESGKAYYELLENAKKEGFKNNLVEGCLNKFDIEKGYFEVVFTSNSKKDYIEFVFKVVLYEKL